MHDYLSPDVHTLHGSWPASTDWSPVLIYLFVNMYVRHAAPPTSTRACRRLIDNEFMIEGSTSIDSDPLGVIFDQLMRVRAQRQARCSGRPDRASERSIVISRRHASLYM